MRIFLTSNASYDPPRGGSTRSNLVWLRHLAQHGHACRVVCTALQEDAESEADGIHIHSVKNLPLRAAVLPQEIRRFDPDFVLVSSEDLSHVLLREAGRAAPGRIVYLAHTPQFFPFGPESWNPDPHAAAIVREARAIVAIGRHMAEYIERHVGVRPEIVHPPVYAEPPYPLFGRFDSGWVLMINPCQVKGIDIFIELARRFPHLTFAALIGWGTTSGDKSALAQLANVQVLESVPRIDDVLSQARVLLMPSLWYEGFGLIAMEAMLRGVPVIASDSGGLVEAKESTGFVIPVRPIERYVADFDEVRMPRPVIPAQDLEPWVLALESLTRDRALYENESERSRNTALNFVSRLDASNLEKLLLSLTPAPSVKHLTPAQKALLIQRLRDRGKK